MTSSGKKTTKKQKEQQQILKDKYQTTNLNSNTNQLVESSIGASGLYLSDQSVSYRQSGQCEVVANSLLDLFDVKFSCSSLGIPEQHEFVLFE